MAAAIALLTAAALGASLIATTRLVTSQSLRRGSDDLAVAREAFNHLVAERVTAVAAQVRLITTQPIFRAHLSDSPHPDDLAILRTMADEYPRQIGAQFCLVIDRQGVWQASPGWPEGTVPPVELASAIRSSNNGKQEAAIVGIGDRLMLVVLEPARFAEETLGVMAVGLALDDSVASELARITQSEIGLVAGRHLAGSSITGEGRIQLARMLETEEDKLSGRPVLLQLGKSKYVGGTFPLLPGAGDGAGPQLVLLRDWTPTQQFLDELQRRVLRAGLIVFVCALAAGLVFSRRMGRPFQDIAAAARDIASGGNWARQVPVRGSAEAMTTASAFNDMTTSLRHWYEEAQAKSERLQASYERFHAVTETARDAIVSTDERGAVTFWNRSAVLTFGYEEGEATGLDLTHLIAAADRPRYIEAFEALHQHAGTPSSFIELTGVRKDGSTVPIELSLSARLADGHVQATAVIRDITDRKRAQEALQQRDEQLRQVQKMEAIGRLAGGVAHDFNNLLTAITGFGTLVKEGLREEDPLRSDIDEVLSASDRASALTRQLLAFSRRQVVMPQVVALDRIVAGTEKMLRRLIGEDINFSSSSPPGLGFVRADPGQVEQVLVNLCVNARDAMPDGGELHVDLRDVDVESAAGHSGLAPGPYVQLTVTDTGRGIEADVLGHIFEPFFTTKERGRGTGLGLATVYGIAKQNGGHVEVESHVGRGTTFRVYFPRLAGNDGHPDEGPSPAPATVTNVSETVLLVEDDDRVRALVANVLRRRGYSVLEATRGDEALELARNHTAPIHLLLSDIVMPGMSGRIVAARVVELRPETRVLLMSGYSDEMTIRDPGDGPRALFIQKPFSTEALAAKIREALSGASVT